MMLKKLLFLLLLAGFTVGPLTACETMSKIFDETGESLDEAKDDLNETLDD